MRLWLSLGLLAVLTAGFVVFNRYSKDVDPLVGAQYERRELAKDFNLPVLGKSQFFTSEDTLSLAQFRNTPTLIHFWASWCMVCREEKPSLDEFWRKHKDSDIRVVGIASFDTKQAMDESQLIRESTFTVILDQEGDVASSYKVSALPVSFLVDSEGYIVEKFLGPLQPYDYTAIENYLESIKSRKSH